MGRASFSCACCGNDVRVVGRTQEDADQFAAARSNEGGRCGSCRSGGHFSPSAAVEPNTGLPPLLGMAPQMAQARPLRHKALPMIDAAAKRFIRRFAATDALSLAAREECIAAVERVAKEFRTVPKASWWIDNAPRASAELFGQLLAAELLRRGEKLTPIATAEVAALKAGSIATGHPTS